MQELRIEIGGTAIALQVDDAALFRRLQRHYSHFLAPDIPPVLEVEIRVLPGARFMEIRPGNWQLEISWTDSILNYTAYFEKGWADFSRGKGELAMARESTPENFLRVLFAHLALQEQRLLVHAAGVIRGDQSFVFVGPSGSGKTTVTRLSQNGTILSDDLVMLGLEGEALVAFGVPFRGDLPEAPRENQRAPVAGIFSLCKGKRHALRDLSRSRQHSILIQCIPFLFEGSAPTGDVLALASKILDRCALRELTFAREAGFWRLMT